MRKACPHADITATTKGTETSVLLPPSSLASFLSLGCPTLPHACRLQAPISQPCSHPSRSVSPQSLFPSFLLSNYVSQMLKALPALLDIPGSSKDSRVVEISLFSSPGFLCASVLVVITLHYTDLSSCEKGLLCARNHWWLNFERGKFQAQKKQHHITLLPHLLGANSHADEQLIASGTSVAFSVVTVTSNH